MKYFILDGQPICSDVMSEHCGRPIRLKSFKRSFSNILILLLIFIVTQSNVLYQKVHIYSNIKPEFNKENFIKAVENLNPSYINLALAQCRYESDFGNSNLYKKTNNLFGLTVFSLKERHYQVGNYSFKIYNTWEESVEDWYKLVSSYQTKALINYMSSYYCTDPGYVQQLTTILKNESQ